MEKIKAYWDRLDASKQRYITVGSVLAIFLVMVGFFVAGADNTEPRVRRQQVVSNLLTNADTRQLGIDGVAARVKGQDEKINQIATETEKRLADFDRRLGSIQAQLGKIDALTASISSLQAEVSKGLQAAGSSTPNPGQGDGGAPRGGNFVTPTDNTPEVPESEIEDLFQVKKEPTPEELRSGRQEKPKMEIRVVRDESQPDDADTKAADDETYLPVGIMSGVLISGIDAPTGQHARNNPHPVIVRIKHEAILANHRRLDLRECFVLASGYGELSSERAMLRTETINCIRNDGGVIESPIDGYITGTDGKAGIRGRLVSRQGQMLANAMKAGALEGFSNVFSRTRVPVIQTGNASETPIYQQAFSEDAVAGGLVQGTGSALERLADYYMDLADQMFPVIEVDAGRAVDITITRGVTLKLRQPPPKAPEERRGGEPRR